jgi:diguanylate cyclase (GGDEF)-like protein/PAS domain S-box-containing protein
MMAAYHVNVFALPNLLVAVVTLMWGLLLRWRDPDSSAGTWAVAVAVAVATWLSGYAGGYVATAPEVAQQWIAIAQIGIIFIGPSLYELLRRLLGLTGWSNRLSLPIWTGAAALLASLFMTDDFLGPPYRYSWGYYAHFRLGGTLLAAFLGAILIFLFVNCLLTWRASPRGSRRHHRARFLLFGFCVSFTATVDFLPCWGVPVYPFGYLMVTFTVVTVGYAAWQYGVINVMSRAAAEQVLKTLSDGVLVVDDLGAVALANDRAALLLGRERSELLGATVRQLLPSVDIDALLAAAATTDVAHAEAELRDSAGERRILDVAANAMRTAPGAGSLTVFALQDVTRYREAADKIRELVYFDQASGLPNRRHLIDKLGQSLKSATAGRSLALCALRLGYIRHLADALANKNTDPVLDEIVTRLKKFSECDGVTTVARIESHEFAVLFENEAPISNVLAQVNRLNKLLRAPIAAGARVIHPMFWLGVSLYPNDGASAGALLERAQAAADQAAELRTESAHFFNVDANVAALQALALDSRLARAIDGDELQPYFQPIINTDTGAIESAEALLRWHDPILGVRLPDEFVPVAEQSGLVVALDEWMLRSACRKAAQWRGRDGARAPRVAVNISGVDLAAHGGADLVATVRAALHATGLSPQRLDIEITETRVVMVNRTVLDNLRRLRGIGVRIAVDDFGTGYASLSYLQQFPLDSLKIDQTYVGAIGRDQIRTALIKSILDLASQLELEVIAEGVEAPHQAAFLRRHGCRLVQGYLFCRPLPADDFVRFADNWTGHPDVTLRLLNQI